MTIKLFDRWDFNEVEVGDEGMNRYISLKPVYVPHTGGKLVGKQFGKSKMNIVERLANKLMRSGQGTKKVAGKYIRGGGNTGNKQNALKILKKAFEIIEKRTKKNPLQVLVDALSNAGPREETTTIIYGGIRYHQAVDVSAQRRVDFGLRYLALGAFATAFNKKKSIEACLADEIILAANNDNKAYAISRKEETERIAHSAR
ncbi:30S ribosomal protein S7 [Candidatus Altiarchaeales archaeon WOR_SM1_SCG]|nr:30S ribosomal protein S7 [Candidatus Altiarchaeales archaeon WOR_SM1_SCG]